MGLLRIGIVLIAAVEAFALDLPSQNDGLVAHEWGTFTSVAGEDGKPVPWASLAGSADLPCFVAHLGAVAVKYVPGLVRMETPVLYFYSSHPATVSVHVEFPQGLITEWYPQSTKVLPERSRTVYSIEKGQIDWDSVEVLPGDESPLPSTQGASRYYAARNTDSVPLRIGWQNEKLIFYRGVGNPMVPLQPTFASDGTLDIRNNALQRIPVAILFENRSGNIGYRLAREFGGLVTWEPPELTSNLADLADELANDLVDAGLYRKEALAMIETWRDSWFEEGTRVFYIVPREQVDQELPLRITPSPSSIVRVFVARIEMFSPEVRKAIETGIAQGDVASLAKFGRFLSPYVSEIQRISGKAIQSRALEAASRQLAQQAKASACVK